MISVTLGALLALPIALARLSRSRVLRGVSLSYVSFFRGTPLLAQLFLVYYGSGQFRGFFEHDRPVVAVPRRVLLLPSSRSR